MKKSLLTLSMVAVALSASAKDHLFSRLTAEQLSEVTSSIKIAIECTQETNYGTYYNGTNSRKNLQSLKSNVAVPEEIVFEWESAGDNKFYVKQLSTGKYLQNNNITTFDTKDNANVAKFTAEKPYSDGSGVHKFGGANCYYIEDADKQYWVRLYLGSTWLNFNGNGYNTGDGVWTVLNVIDLSDYYKLTVNEVKEGNTTTTTQYVKSGTEFTFATHVGYDGDKASITMGSSDQEVTVNYTINPRAQLQALVELAENIKSGENVGDYTTASVMAFQNPYMIAGGKLADTETEITAADVADLKSALDALEIVQPESGKLYRIKSKTSSKYITTPANGNTGTAMVLEATTSNRNVIYLEGHNLLCFGTGYYINDANHAIYNWKGTYTFEPSKTYSSGYVSIKVGSNYFSATSTSASLALAAVDQVDALDWKIEEVTFLPVPVNKEAGYATLYAPVALNNSYTTTKRVAAYTGVINGDVLSLTSVDEDGVIPANTPVVLEYLADIQSDGCVYLEVSSSTKAAVESDLKGTFKSSYIEGASYVLAMPEDQVVGFYAAELDNNNQFLNNGFKAYLPKPSESGARFLNFDFGTETAIESVEGAENANAVVYDLAGRRVQGVQKGLYIVNGKKVIK